jgi:predicted DNA-binding transcriptional regulator YafY
LGNESVLVAAGFAGNAGEQREKLARAITELNSAGWDVQNVAARDRRPRYVLRPRHGRIQVALSRAEQAELLRAARLRDSGLAESAAAADADGRERVTFWRCVDAVARRRRLRFVYRGAPCDMHPRSVTPGPSGWYVVGRREGDGGDSYIDINQIEDLEIDAPGTGAVAPRTQRHGLDPATWDADPPVEVDIETSSEFAGEVEMVFGPALSRRDLGERIMLTFGVTNRAVFRERLYTFGARVRVVAPEGTLGEIHASLTTLADE